MQFQVPQFIEVEDKIFGPLTFKQFVYIGGGLGACYMLWRILPLIIAGPLIAAIGGLAAALAFFQVNGRPFILALENAFFFFVHTKLYLWNNRRREIKRREIESPGVAESASGVYIPRLSSGKLHELAWSLDIKERVAAGVADDSDRRAVRPGNIMAPIRTAQQARI